MEVGSAADWFSGTMSALAVVVALAGFKLADRQRNKDLAVARRKAADQTFVKLLTVVNSIHTIHRHLNTQANSDRLQGPDGPETWRMIQPMIGFSDEATIQFGADEAGLFIEAKQSEFLMDLMLLGRRHAALISALQEYALRRDALTKLSPAPTSFKGLVGSVHLTPDEYARIRPYTIQVESLIQTIIGFCDSDLKLALSLTDRFGAVMEKVLGDKSYIKLSTVNENSATN